MEDPAAFLNGIDARFDCIVRPGQTARIDDDHVAFVNHEVYFFADGVSRHRFQRHPLRWCGAVTDPVSLERFAPDPGSPRLEWAGRPYYFASEETRTTFVTDPDMYAKPRKSMTEEKNTEEERTGAG